MTESDANTPIPPVIFEPTWRDVESLMEGAQRSVFICSPFLASSGIEHLRQVLSCRLTLNTEVEIWTRLTEPINDPAALLKLVDEVAERITIRLYDHPNLHAKIYMADDATALIGSANWSAPGFGRNLEVMARIESEPEISQLREVITHWRYEVQHVHLEHFRYFVDVQLPELVVEKLPEPPKPHCVPRWRWNVATATQEMRKHVESVEYIAPETLYTRLNRKWMKPRDLDKLQREVPLGYDLHAHKGKRIQIRIAPAGQHSQYSVQGKLPLSTVVGSVIDSGYMVQVATTYDQQPKEFSGHIAYSWKFRSERTSADYFITLVPTVNAYCISSKHTSAYEERHFALHYVIDYKVLEDGAEDISLFSTSL